MKKYTLTITRQFYSMGRSIAKQLSGMLGIEFYDRDIVEEVAKKLNLPVRTISDKEEKSRKGLFGKNLPFPLESDEDYMQKLIFDTQRDIIREWAEKSSCILVGRCSDFILEDQENNLNFFIYAPYAYRLINCMNALHLDETKSRHMIEDMDRARRAYHRKYAGYLPGDPEHKQFMIDSSVLGVDGTAELIAKIVRMKFAD